MAGKKKKKDQRPTPSSGDALRQEVERLIGKEHYKDAIKQAKIGYRDAGTGENHRLLERAYLLRARQLQRAGMPKSAVEVAGQLVEFGVTDPALIEESARLLLALGMSGEAGALLGRLESPEARARLELVAADQAVLHPDRMAAAPAEIRRGAATVRAALEAVEAGDEAKAVEGLREVARSSPFADWKLFARGLAAFRRREAREADANWDKLDAGRPASRIARALRGTGPAVAANPDGNAAGAAKAQDFSALERQVFGEPVLAPLARVRDQVAQGRWPEAVRELGPICHALRRVDRALAERLTRILLSPLIREAEGLRYDDAEALIGKFTRLAEPLAIDPNWNRLWALIWEGPQADLQGALEYWGKYLEDLETSAALPPDERALAQALVWKHLAVLNAGEAEDFEEADDFGPPTRSGRRPVGEGASAARRRAVACLEHSIRLAPAHLPAHEMLVRLLQRWDQPKEVVAAAVRLLETFPDHFETLVFLAGHHLDRDEPDRALDYARRARALKPLDADTAGLEWNAHVSMARHLALRGRFDEGRAELEAADRLQVDPPNRYRLLARKAVFELKAGRADLAERLIGEARGLLSEPGPLWLMIEIEASRYDLPKADRDRFAGLGKVARKARRRGETAGKMAEILDGYLAADVAYPGREEHVREVVEYLRGAAKLKFTPDALAHVCSFLGALPKESALLEKMAGAGLKAFPEDPYFHFLTATLELKKGPFRARTWVVRRHFEEALRLCQASADPKHAGLLPKVKEGLALVESLTTGPMGGMPFAGFGRGGPTLDDLAEIFGRAGIGDFYDDDDDEEEDLDDFGPPIDLAPPPARRRRPAPKRRKK